MKTMKIEREKIYMYVYIINSSISSIFKHTHAYTHLHMQYYNLIQYILTAVLKYLHEITSYAYTYT